MPYLYSAVRETSRTGMPIMRALWLHHPDDPVAVARGDQYLWGRDILVAPVVEKNATSRNVYLPRGAWFDFWTGERIDGGREISRAVDLTILPLYVRAGAIIPMGPLKQYTSEPVDGPLELTVYPGADGSLDLFEDDGHSFNGVWMGLSLRWDDRTRRLSIALTPGSRMRPPLTREVVIRLAGGEATRTVRFDGRTQVIGL
jgi:alpha-glucosidase/alpha-D-xyloside xylohydrolase